ncbi:MAG: uncharacterized protein KVP18_000226 [Porospora cf. gigantea A]|uniref:uncharacterized protein n=1 Tax=Porospora cf. gigantea A TaxID=2853593 RepID=UPI003559DE50|nr:MAG: hypothetical protein KVP18_000226 [Porospora cf. gigantea A]
MRKIHSQVSVDLPQPVIRPYDPKDGDAVRSMCFSHFRGLSLPAVQYYVAQHLTDFAVLTLLGYLFTGAIRKVIAMSCLFLLYLFVRAYYEMRAYILYNCPDLMSIEKSYAGTSSFWVAEITGPKGARIVGCVGIAPSRTTPSSGQLLRLVVLPECRRMRVGSRLLLAIENVAIEKGFEEIRLHTNNLNTAHMNFIGHHGYQLVSRIPRLLMRGDLLFWQKKLTEKKSPRSRERTVTDAMGPMLD